ncbi:MAG: thermonuclease family protein [Candidatus Omnitrophica bacterium]|jgi:micrococcal nuclease|nr:thermonuclease family protein [Candidatus Omnitrophota bacterium]
MNMRSVTFITVCTFFIVLLAVSPCAYADNLEVVRTVIDGDTIILEDGRHIRYIGIDTPEIRRRKGQKWVYAPMPYALEARSINSSLVMGKEIQLEYDSQRKDKYGRDLAYVYVDGFMVNEELLRKGVGCLTVYAPNFKYTDRLALAQRHAMTEKVGLWETVQDTNIEGAHELIGFFASVSGVVSGVAEHKDSVFLNFNAQGSPRFSAVIWKSNIHFFTEKEWNAPEAYVGEKVKVFGTIGYGKVAQMILFHPVQLVLDE